ncbi:MAG: class I SAM-dependent methyltransferase [Candidatus Omnitrophica bacterium]|nr:class I SAM-dependent methyltransferase [Candidatus Omnitrophota bacterium]
MAIFKRIFLLFKNYIIAIVCCIYLFTLGIFNTKHRGFLSQICLFFGFVKSKSIIPKINFSQATSENIEIQLRELSLKDGNISTTELVIINKLIKAKNPKTLFEIGTFDGRSTLNMAANSTEGARVYTLDIKQQNLNSTKLRIEPGDRSFIDKEEIGRRYKGSDYEKKITQLYGDSAMFDFSPYYNSIDFVFIDGSHSYEYALNDSRKALKLLRNGKGVILWHDYGSPTWPGVTKALEELFLLTSDFKGLKYIEGTSLVCLIV